MAVPWSLTTSMTWRTARGTSQTRARVQTPTYWTDRSAPMGNAHRDAQAIDANQLHLASASAIDQYAVRRVSVSCLDPEHHACEPTRDHPDPRLEDQSSRPRDTTSHRHRN